jgi:hypothetical protein
MTRVTDVVRSTRRDGFAPECRAPRSHAVFIAAVAVAVVAVWAAAMWLLLLPLGLDEAVLLR